LIFSNQPLHIYSHPTESFCGSCSHPKSINECAVLHKAAGEFLICNKNKYLIYFSAKEPLTTASTILLLTFCIVWVLDFLSFAECYALLIFNRLHYAPNSSYFCAGQTQSGNRKIRDLFPLDNMNKNLRW